MGLLGAGFERFMGELHAPPIFYLLSGQLEEIKPHITPYGSILDNLGYLVNKRSTPDEI